MEGFEKWDKLAKKYGDPLELLFNFQADEDLTPEIRAACARDCVRYRYPSLKAIEVQNLEPVEVIITDEGADRANSQNP